MGAESTWADIANGVDARRGITLELIERVLGLPAGVQCILLTGYAGAGKTAALMRAGCEVARSGKSVYFFKAEEALDHRSFVEFCRSLGDHGAVFFIDRAARHTRSLELIGKDLAPDANVHLVLADRPHTIFPRRKRLEALRPQEISMPELDREDVELVLDKLDENGFLGVLQGKPRAQQVNAFLVRAKKQLLVALREATSGRGFDAILQEEFETLEGEQAKLAYTIASLAVMHGAPGIRRRHLLACLDGTDESKARVLRDSLREVVIPVSPESELLAPRHRLIGQFVAENTAPRRLRRTAIERLLCQIAGDITPQTIRRRVPEYVAYRGLVNYKGLRRLFGPDYETLVEIYEAIKPFYKHDFLYWLQYGRTELEFDHFDLAEKNLDQSLAIRQDSFHTLHHLGVLCLKRSYTQGAYAEREDDAKRGEELLFEQIELRGAEDPYPYAAYLHHKLECVLVFGGSDRRRALDRLRSMAQKAKALHPLDRQLRESCERVEREYMMQTVSRR